MFLPWIYLHPYIYVVHIWSISSRGLTEKHQALFSHSPSFPFFLWNSQKPNTRPSSLSQQPSAMPIILSSTLPSVAYYFPSYLRTRGAVQWRSPAICRKTPLRRTRLNGLSGVIYSCYRKPWVRWLFYIYIYGVYSHYIIPCCVYVCVRVPICMFSEF